MKPCDTKREMTTQKKNDIEALIKSITQHSYFEKKPTSRWVDFKTTHQLDWSTQNLHMCIH
jgi:hypothetical protein